MVKVMLYEFQGWLAWIGQVFQLPSPTKVPARAWHQQSDMWVN